MKNRLTTRTREDGTKSTEPHYKEWGDGIKVWYLNGKLHREAGPAIEYPDGRKGWYLNGKLHREDGPAVEDSDGYKAWSLNGNSHREDGPAIEYPDGSKGWYLNGIQYSEQDYYRELVGRGIKTLEEVFLMML